MPIQLAAPAACEIALGAVRLEAFPEAEGGHAISNARLRKLLPADSIRTHDQSAGVRPSCQDSR